MKRAAAFLIMASLILLFSGYLVFPDMLIKTVEGNPEKLVPNSSPVSLNLRRLDVADAENINSESGGARANTFTLLQHHSATALADMVSAGNLENTLRHLTKGIGARQLGGNGNAAARDFLMGELQALGFSENEGTLARQGFYVFDMYTENVFAVIPSRVPNPQILLIGAHFDSVSNEEGSVDNGSGTASLLEIVRVIKESGLEFDYELRFCFFSAEENGYYGAYRYLDLQDRDSLSRHAAFINMDMTAFEINDAPKAIVVSTRAQSNGDGPAEPNVISRSADSAYETLDLRDNDFYSAVRTGNHDIVPFFRQGVPCATFSWREIDFSRAVDNDLGIAVPMNMHHIDFEGTDINSLTEMTRLVLASASMAGDRISLS